MTRRCDRCRAPYESGADLGGHDYCMTCYTILKQADERKRYGEERLREKKEQKLIVQKKHYLHLDYMREADARKVRARDEAQARLLREAAQEALREKRELPTIKRHYAVKGTEPLKIFTPLLKKRKPVPRPEQKSNERAAYAPPLQPAAKKDGKKKAKKPQLPEKQALSLSVASGLPVSLSVGQKQIQLLLIGKNSSSAPMAVGLRAIVLDSQKTQVAAKLDPRASTIDPEGESKFRLEFDLPEGIARGRLTLSARLKENAVYIDKQSAQSNTIALSSQVKFSMSLQYRGGSAKFAENSIILSFSNVGESGGILETASSVSYTGEGGVESKANLISRTKVKGGQKSVELAFSPAEPAQIERLELDLLGKDSNGKPYALKKKINEKEETNPS